MLLQILACVFHEGRVAGASALARGVRVSVVFPLARDCRLRVPSGQALREPQDRLRGAQGDRNRESPLWPTVALGVGATQRPFSSIGQAVTWATPGGSAYLISD